MLDTCELVEKRKMFVFLSSLQYKDLSEEEIDRKIKLLRRPSYSFEIIMVLLAKFLQKDYQWLVEVFQHLTSIKNIKIDEVSFEKNSYDV